MIWLKLNKNVFGFQRDVVIGCCYIPPENSSRQVRDDFDMYNAIITYMAQFDVKYNCEFLVCGDFNSRTALLPDYVLNDNSSHIPLPDDYIADDQSVIPRQNSDKVINNNGRKLIDMCKMCNLRIANGRLGHDAGVGNFTCRTYNGQSCVDYVLFSPNLINDIEMFTVEPQTEYSDHRPVTFMLKCDMLCMFTDVNLANGQNRMIWDIEKKDVFLNNLVWAECTEELNSLLNFLSSADGNEENVNKAVSIFVETVRKAADPIF